MVAIGLSFAFIARAHAQDDTPEELNRRIQELYHQGRFKEAIPLAEKAVVLTKSAKGDGDPVTAQSLNNLAAVRGSGSLPTTAASAASGCTGLLRAFFGAAAFFGVGIGQLERAGLGCQAKNQPCFTGKAIDWNHGNAERACGRSNPVNRNFRS